MTIRRTRLPFEGNFTQVPNAWLRDKRLSRRARGLLAELMSHAEGYRISIEYLVANGTEGRDAVRATVRELAKYGYLKAGQKRRGGRYAEADYELAAPGLDGITPILTGAELVDNSSPWTEKPTTVKPTSVQPTPKKNNLPTEEEEQGGADAPTTTPRPDPWCKRHAATEGTDRPCAACGKAREAANRWELNLIAGSREDQWTPQPSKAWRPGLCIPHLQKLGECAMCEAEGIA